MPNRKPRKIDIPIAIAELKNRILYSNDIDSGVVNRIADELGCCKETVYKTLDGDIKSSLDFLYAVVVATGGDPVCKKYLEPDGFELLPTNCVTPDKPTLAEECLDDIPHLAEFHTECMKGSKATRARLMILRNQIIGELDQNIAMWEREKAK